MKAIWYLIVYFILQAFFTGLLYLLVEKMLSPHKMDWPSEYGCYMFLLIVIAGELATLGGLLVVHFGGLFRDEEKS